jgi:hypothetical protein
MCSLLTFFRLKPESAKVIGQLNCAGVRSCMVTGDHVLTAVTVSRNCGIIHPTRPVLVAELVPVPTKHSQNTHTKSTHTKSHGRSGAACGGACDGERTNVRRFAKAKSSGDLSHEVLMGATAQPNAGLQMIHTTHPSVDYAELSASSANTAAAEEAAGGLQVQVGSMRDSWGRDVQNGTSPSPSPKLTPKSTSLPSPKIIPKLPSGGLGGRAGGGGGGGGERLWGAISSLGGFGSGIGGRGGGLGGKV